MKQIKLGGLCIFPVLAVIALGGAAHAECAIPPRHISYLPNSSMPEGREIATAADIATQLHACTGEYSLHILGFAAAAERANLATSRARYIREYFLNAGIPMAAISSYGREGVRVGLGDGGSEVVTIQVVPGRLASSDGLTMGQPAANESILRAKRPAQIKRMEEVIRPAQERQVAKAPSLVTYKPARAETNALPFDEGVYYLKSIPCSNKLLLALTPGITVIWYNDGIIEMTNYASESDMAYNIKKIREIAAGQYDLAVTDERNRAISIKLNSEGKKAFSYSGRAFHWCRRALIQ